MAHNLLMPRPKEHIPIPDVNQWQYLFEASLATLRSFECTRLHHAETLFGQMATLAKKHAEELAAAALARTLLQCRPYVSVPTEIPSLNLAARIITQLPEIPVPEGKLTDFPSPTRSFGTVPANLPIESPNIAHH